MRREGRPTSRNRTSCSACDDARTDRMPTSRGMRRLRLDFPNWRPPNVESGLPSSMPPQRSEPLSRNASRSLSLSKGRALRRHRCRSLSTGRPPSMSLTEGRSPSKTPPGCRSPIPNRSTEPARHRGGAAAACCPGSSPRWRCWPQPSASASVSSSSMSRTSPTRSRVIPEDAVAQLTPQGQPGSASIPVDDDVPVRYGLTVADFVSYGSYGPLQIWSTTKLENKRCIAVVGENHISVFECTAPSVDTIADYNIDPNELPPAPSGELTPYVRFVLHDEVVDVYRPKEGASSTDPRRPKARRHVRQLSGLTIGSRTRSPTRLALPRSSRRSVPTPPDSSMRQCSVRRALC